jgi:hypothetical protein
MESQYLKAQTLVLTSQPQRRDAEFVFRPNIAATVENALLNVKISLGLDTAAQRSEKKHAKDTNNHGKFLPVSLRT